MQYPGPDDNKGYPGQPGGFGYPPQQQGFPAPQGGGFPPQQAGYAPPQPYPPTQTFPPMQTFPQGALIGQDNFAHVGSDEMPGDGSFGDKAVRRGFIRKVYAILMCQLTLTGVIIATFMFVGNCSGPDGRCAHGEWSIKQYVRQNRWPYYTSMALMLVCLISMACCESVRRKTPTNFIFLTVFTACEGVMLGTVSTFYDVDAVLIAVGITAGVTFALTVFAFQTKIDFTACGGMLCALLVIFMIAGVVLMFLPKTKWVMVGFGSAGALIFSLYIIYDTQLMMGGKHKYSLSPEEYIFAALNIYLDIINLFMYILMIVGAARGD